MDSNPGARRLCSPRAPVTTYYQKGSRVADTFHYASNEQSSLHRGVVETRRVVRGLFAIDDVLMTTRASAKEKTQTFSGASKSGPSRSAITGRAIWREPRFWL